LLKQSNYLNQCAHEHVYVTSGAESFLSS